MIRTSLNKMYDTEFLLQKAQNACSVLIWYVWQYAVLIRLAGVCQKSGIFRKVLFEPMKIISQGDSIVFQ